MRLSLIVCCLGAAVAMPTVGRSQVCRMAPPPPAIPAAPAPWQQSGAAVVVAGATYFPSGPTEVFDGRVMVQAGAYDGVAISRNMTPAILAPPDTGRHRAAVPDSGPQEAAVQTVPGPESNVGVWIRIEGSRWVSAGRAVDLDPQRFEPAGTYRGSVIYRERGGPPDRLFVTMVPDGPLAPFDRR